MDPDQTYIALDGSHRRVRDDVIVRAAPPVKGKLCCPECDGEEFQELGYRATWQPVTIADDGAPEDYGSFDYGDDVWVNGVECLGCQNVWPSYAELLKAVRGEAHATGYLPDSEVFPATAPVWIVIRDLQEVDVFASEQAAREHEAILRRAGYTELLVREEQVAREAWAGEAVEAD